MDARRDKRYGVVQFNGTDYDSWKFRVESTMRAEGYELLLEQTDAVSTKKYEDTNKKGLAFLVRFLSDSHLTYTRTSTYVWEIFQKLDAVYLKESTANRIFLKREFQALKLEIGGDQKTHFRKFDKLISDLRMVGCKSEENDLIEQLLMSMSDEYKVTVEVIERINNPTLELVKQKLLNTFSKLKQLQDSKPVETIPAFIVDGARNNTKG